MSRTPLILLTLVFVLTSPLQAARGDDSALAALVELLGGIEDAQVQLDLLDGIHEALRGRKRAAPPAGWKPVFETLSASPSLPVRRKALVLALIFEDLRAALQLKGLVANSGAPIEQRRWALQTLVEHGAAEMAPLLHSLLDTPPLRGDALQALARYPSDETPALVLARYPQLTVSERQFALATLASRPAYAAALMEAVRKKRLEAREISSFHVRQIRAFDNQELNRAVEQLWGKVGGGSAARKQLIAAYKGRLSERVLEGADLINGRRVFTRSCAACHRLYGLGGAIGPDLTGSNRNNLDYVLENVLDPSDAVAKDYQLTTVRTLDGRVVSGIARQRSKEVLELQTLDEKLLLPLEDIDQQRTSPVSMMPDGLFDKLSFDEVRDLVAYLAVRKQVALPDEEPSVDASRPQP